MAAVSLSLSSSATSAAAFPYQHHHRIPPPRAAALGRLPPPLLPRPARSMLLARAKFEKFDGADPPSSPSAPEEEEDPAAPPDPAKDADEDDSCLPSDLEGAIRQSGEASAMFIASGGMRAIVELLIPQLQFLNTEGAQAEVWELSRIFLETLIEESGFLRVKAIFPDSGVAALLKYQWKDVKFGCSSLSDRNPVDDEDEVVVMIIPDYQMLEYVERIANRLSDDPPRPLVMWNPRLVSGDVGVGFNVRKLRRYFLSTFTTVYSMRPLPSGAIFRCYPGVWKVFYDDVNRPNRYLLAKEQPDRPDATDVEVVPDVNFFSSLNFFTCVL
ncbi:hypothetical protein ACMD2_04101 [Ananas comosus]|uniref:DUF1995 domain-containing protein n=1 Tax=Ananas comosus TaxID=4615 RepID=A0A199W7N3_ANACO|nr:hypothetical protein ACMD2_04101 [Ananas comosus]